MRRTRKIRVFYNLERRKDVFRLFENFQGKFIWSADVTLEVLREVINGDFPKDEVAVKLDRLFFEKYGREIIKEVQGLGVAVFADTKFAEIPSKILEITKLYLDCQPWMLNVMAGSSDTRMAPGYFNPNPTEDPLDLLHDFSKLCKDAGTNSCAVTLLTPKRESAVLMEYGKSRMEVVLDYAKLAFDCGCTDVVCSSEESLNVHEINNALGINTPAIRLPASGSDDQANVNTPYAAFKNCATRLVIGRDLSKNNDFYGNLGRIWENVNGGGLV